MDTLASLLNKSIENITILNNELNKLKSSHNLLTNKYLESCNTIKNLQNKKNLRPSGDKKVIKNI